MSSPSIQSIVDRQARRWARSIERLTRSPQPTVAFARERFSGVHRIAESVAERLGFGFFGGEIVDEIAKDEGVRRELVAGLDERVENAIDRFVLDGFRHRQFEESDYVRAVTRVVTTIARRGSAVIVGRGASAIVDPACALRVLVIAPVEWRAARLAEARHVPIADARSELATEDRQRREFYRRTFNFDQLDPLRHDLVINSASLGVEVATTVVVSAFRARFPSWAAAQEPAIGSSRNPQA